MKRSLIFFVFLVLIYVNFISADNATSTTYSVGSYHLGSSGSNVSSSTYNAVNTLTSQQGAGNLSSSTYSGSSNWFSIIFPTEEETPAPSTPSAPGAAGGSGGGAAGTVSYQTFEGLKTIPESFNIPAVVGIESSAKISVFNTGNTGLNIKIALLALEGIVEFSETEFHLVAGETRILEFAIIPPNEAGIYTGKIIFVSEDKGFEVPFVINVNSELSLFDVSINLANKVISEGKNLIGQITLIQAGLQEKVDVTIEYTIRDFEGNIYSRISETLAVFREKSFEYEFDTSGLVSGEYLIGVEVIYSGGVATASHQFRVVGAEAGFAFNIILLIILLAMIFIIIILIIIAKNYKRKTTIE